MSFYWEDAAGKIKAHKIGKEVGIRFTPTSNAPLKMLNYLDSVCRMINTYDSDKRNYRKYTKITKVVQI